MNKFASVLALIAVNLIPLAGVLFFGWSVLSVVSLYWWESVLIGFFNVFKMMLAQGAMGNVEIEGKKLNGSYAKGCIIPFFMVHYNGFMLGQGVFITITLLQDTKQIITHFNWMPYFISLGALFISHLIAFFQHYIFTKKYKTASLQGLMFAPYGRVFIQQFVVIGGVFMQDFFPSQLSFLLILIVLKIFADIVGYLWTESPFKIIEH